MRLGKNMNSRFITSGFLNFDLIVDLQFWSEFNVLFIFFYFKLPPMI